MGSANVPHPSCWHSCGASCGAAPGLCAMQPNNRTLESAVTLTNPVVATNGATTPDVSPPTLPPPPPKRQRRYKKRRCDDHVGSDHL